MFGKEIGRSFANFLSNLIHQMYLRVGALSDGLGVEEGRMPSLGLPYGHANPFTRLTKYKLVTSKNEILFGYPQVSLICI